MSTEFFLTGQSDGGNSSIEVTPSQIALVYIQLTKTYLATQYEVSYVSLKFEIY